MKLLITYFILFTIIISCRRDISPLSNEEYHIQDCGCSVEGLHIDFVDTCSNNFIISFLESCDSVEIEDSYYGVDLFLYADSGDSDYWSNYFKSDSSNFGLRFQTISDSLVLIFRFNSEVKYRTEEERLISCDNLHFLKYEDQINAVFVNVPENTESIWISYFNKFEFIESVELIVICCDY